MDKVVVDVTLNEDDVVEFQKAHYSRRVKPGMRYSILATISVLFIVNLVLDITSGKYITITSGLLAAILIVLLGTPLMFRFSAKKGLKTNKMLMAEHTYTFTKDGIASVSEHGKLDTEWATMYEFRESKNNFLFYIGNNQAFMIPKRYFDDSAKLALVREWAAVIPEPKKPFNLLFITMGVTLAIIVFLFIILIIIN